MCSVAYDLATAAREAAVSEQDLYNAIKSGDLTAKMSGSNVIVARHDLTRWVDRLPDWAASK